MEIEILQLRCLKRQQSIKSRSGPWWRQQAHQKRSCWYHSGHGYLWNKIKGSSHSCRRKWIYLLSLWSLAKRKQVQLWKVGYGFIPSVYAPFDKRQVPRVLNFQATCGFATVYLYEWAFEVQNVMVELESIDIHSLNIWEIVSDLGH